MQRIGAETKICPIMSRPNQGDAYKPDLLKVTCKTTECMAWIKQTEFTSDAGAKDCGYCGLIVKGQ